MKLHIEPSSARDIVIRLTEEEAGYLLKLVNNVGGNPYGPRGFFRDIGKKLRSHNVQPEGFSSGSVYIEATTEEIQKWEGKTEGESEND